MNATATLTSSAPVALYTITRGAVVIPGLTKAEAERMLGRAL